MKRFLILSVVILMATGPSQADEPSSSSPDAPLHKPTVGDTAVRSATITFSEHPVGTSITTQYRDIGVIFGGSSPYITTDSANATSPVLTGSPRFQGSVEGRFVRPGTDEPTAVQSFRIDAGYFNEIGSTRLEWFDPDGTKLGQKTNTQLGIETLEVEAEDGGNIARWLISIVANEPAGFAVDNVSFEPIGPSILFREKSGDDKDGTWGFFVDSIPGFDHVGFHLDDVVYESHPGYPTGTYTSADGQESVSITSEDGVQGQHTRASFEHDSTSQGSTPVIDFEEIPISEELAAAMKTAIDRVGASTFQYINYSSIENIQATLSPAAQKGGDGTFTCVGLIEWAAEQAGHRGGQGFISNRFESMTVPDPRDRTKTIVLPLLSPALLNYAMRGQQLLQTTQQWFQGFFDPVDVLVTDPLGRRIGYVPGVGLVNEIPHALYSGDGDFEQILIPQAIPGDYIVELHGVGDDALVAVSTADAAMSINRTLAVGETDGSFFYVAPMPGGRGDVDGDGDVDTDDVDALIPLLNTFTDGLEHPGDIDGDGLLSDTDVDLLRDIVDHLRNRPVPEPTPLPDEPFNQGSDVVSIGSLSLVDLMIWMLIAASALVASLSRRKPCVASDARSTTRRGR